MTKLFKAVLLLSLQAFTANSYGYIHIEPFIGARMGGNEYFHTDRFVGASYKKSRHHIGSKIGVETYSNSYLRRRFPDGKTQIHRSMGRPHLQ